MKIRSSLGLVALLAVIATKLQAQDIWTGGGVNTHWSTAGNWSAGVPANDGSALIQFSNTSAFTSYVDVNWSLSAITVQSAAGALTLNGGNTTLTLENGFTDSSSSHVTFSSGVGLAGSEAQLVIDGGSQFKFDSTNNTYGGGTIVTAGTLVDGAANAFSPNSVLSIDNPGAAHVNYNETVAGLSDYLTGNGSVVIASGATLSVVGGNTSTFTGSISGSGSLTVSGSGVLTLNGASSYSGGTLVTNGAEIFVGTNSAVGSGTLTFNPGTEMSPSANVTLANAILLNGGATLDNDDGGSNTLKLTGVISEAGGPGSITWCTNAVLTLVNSNTFTGGVDMREGTLLLGSDTAAGSGTITLDTGTILGTYPGPGTTRIIANNVNLTGSTEEMGQGGNNFLTVDGVISGSGALVFDPGSAGSVTPNNANTFTGSVAINSGTVYATNSGSFGAAGNAVSVNNGSTLSVASGVTLAYPLSFSGSANVLTGTGTIASAVTADSKVVVSPGSTLGNLTFSSGLTLATGGAISFHLYDATGVPGTGYSLITASGGLTLSASANTLTFDLVSVNGAGGPAPAINFNSASPYSWTFATSSSAITGFSASQFNLNTSQFANATNGGTFSFSESGNSLMLNFTPVPEPATWATLGLGILGISPLALRRRRGQRA